MKNKPTVEEVYMTKLVMFRNGLIDVKKCSKDIAKDLCCTEASKVARDEIVKALEDIIKDFKEN